MCNRRAVIILAAGKGKRMKSDLPKVLHTVDGRSLIRILLDTLSLLNFDRTVVVVGYGGDLVERELAGLDVDIVWQKEQLGTGHAAMMAREALSDFAGTVMVALGDVPFLSVESIRRLFQVHEETGAAATCLSAVVDDPTGYGRVVRVDGSDLLKGIVEHEEASAETLKIKEINTGLFCFDKVRLFEALEKLDNNNTQGEYYLTDTVNIMHRLGLRVAVVEAQKPDEWRGVNSLQQLAQLAKRFTA